MFRKLRIKFIAVVMASVAIVLAVVFAGICVTEYQRSVSEVHEALLTAVDRAVMVTEGTGRFEGRNGQLRGERDNGNTPEGTDGQNGIEANAEGGPENGIGFTRPEDTSSELGDEPFDGEPPRIGGRGDDRLRSLIPLAVYTVGEDAQPTVVSSVTTASVSSDVLSDAATRALAATEEVGLLDDLGLHYYRRTVMETTYVAFADVANTSGWESLALTLVIAGLGTLAVFFVISLFLSRWALKPVRETWDAQRQFVADASHDLKTPLTVILANSSILLKHPESSIASQSQWIESTQTEANAMQGLVAEMLELAQVEERAQLAHEPVDLTDMVDAETLQFESLAFEQGCTFECAIEEGIGVLGDEAKLRKMVSTLIENALKYVDDGGTVSVALERAGRNARLIVRNTGPAIAPEDLPHIFDRFYRTDKARTSGTGGFGLGLAIARETARAHNGDITCTSTSGEGTTFTVSLPLQ